MFLVLVFVYVVLMCCCVGSSVDVFCCLSQHVANIFRYRFVVCHSGFCFFAFLIFSGWGMSMVVRLFNFKISCNVLAGAIELLMLVCFSVVMICLV